MQAHTLTPTRWDGDALASIRDELATRLRARKAELQDAVVEHLRSAFPDTTADGDDRLGPDLREVIGACIDYGLAGIEPGTRETPALPAALAAYAQRNAAGGVDLKTALGRTVAGHTLMWGVVLRELATLGLSEQQHLALLLDLSGPAGSLLASLQAEIADIHTTEIRRRASSREQRRADLAHRLLAGETLDAGEQAALGYELGGWHTGLIASGPLAMHAVHALAGTVRRELLAIVHRRDTVWAWLGGEQRLPFADLRHALPSEQARLLVAVGEPASGLEGWRQTHREAHAAMLVARWRPRPLTRYLDVAADAAALQDDALADALIEAYLAPLDGMRIGGQAARRTLGTLLDKAHNVSSTASALHLDRSTVHRQRNEIERRLGCRLHERQAEIAVALRVEELRQRRDDDRRGLATVGACCC